MYHSWSGAYSYLECQPFGGTLIRTWFSSSGPQPWGYARSYEVVWAGGDDDRWRVNIAGQDRGIYGPAWSPNCQVQARSEVLGNSANQLMGGFNNVSWRGTAPYSYQLFDQDRWVVDSPYTIVKYSKYKYSTHGNGM